MKQSGLVILCAHNTRSSAYIQALAAAGIEPEAVVLYGTNSTAVNSQRNLTPAHLSLGLFCPDVTLPAADIIRRLGWRSYVCESTALDSVELQGLLQMLQPSLLVFSGYGGQIVPASVLKCAPVLHIHSGALPRYRGSTTIYYEILEHRQCAASAILLDESIDTGPVLLVCRYALPPAGTDIDYLYDNVIRADVLVKVLAYKQQHGALPVPATQQEEHPPYFIIHPVLKHLALLTVDSGAS